MAGPSPALLRAGLPRAARIAGRRRFPGTHAQRAAAARLRWPQSPDPSGRAHAHVRRAAVLPRSRPRSGASAAAPTRPASARPPPRCGRCFLQEIRSATLRTGDAAPPAGWRRSPPHRGAPHAGASGRAQAPLAGNLPQFVEPALHSLQILDGLASRGQGLDGPFQNDDHEAMDGFPDPSGPGVRVELRLTAR